MEMRHIVLFLVILVQPIFGLAQMSGSSHASDKFIFPLINKGASSIGMNRSCGVIIKSQLCREPVSKICPNFKKDKLAALISSPEKQQIRDEITRRIYLKSPRLKGVQRLPNGAPYISDIERHPDLYLEYFQQLQLFLENNIDFKSAVKTAKQSFRSGISNNFHLSEFGIKDLLQKTDEFDVVIFPEYLAFQKNDNDRRSIIAEMTGMNVCQTDGLGDNATYREYEGKKYLVLCPGALLSRKGNPLSQNQKHSLAFILAHENGHMIDFDNVPAVYERFSKCMINRGFPIEQMNELTADYWAALSVVENIKAELGTSVKGYDIHRFLMRSLNRLCVEGSDTHPNIENRMNFILHIPALREMMGCEVEPTSSQSCSL